MQLSVGKLTFRKIIYKENKFAWASPKQIGGFCGGERNNTGIQMKILKNRWISAY